ncbi:MAG: addiction module protein [Candidatus Hydrogenedentes bacterium]|nr:addiction module protein [Candidatus Hydrogenedentota bacterium]
MWVEEAERRYQAYKQGRVAARSVEEALESARSQVR